MRPELNGFKRGCRELATMRKENDEPSAQQMQVEAALNPYNQSDKAGTNGQTRQDGPGKGSTLSNRPARPGAVKASNPLICLDIQINLL
jgi:hypothetical protein